MLTKEDQSKLIGQLRQFPEEIRAVVEDLSEDQLDTPYREGGWTVRQVVHHLADAHLNGYVRFKLIITEDQPTLKPYDQVKWAELEDACCIPVSSSLEILGGLHLRWVLLLESLSDEAWQRTAHHPEVGTVSLADLLFNYTHHCKTHLSQITDLRSRQGWN